MNPISPDVFPDAKWSWWNRPMVAIRTKDGVGEVYIMDDTIPSYIGDVQSIAIGKQKYTPERTCSLKLFMGQNETADILEGVCSKCSAFMDSQMRFCPNCGAKVVE